MRIYQSKYDRLPGSTYAELIKNASKIYNEIRYRTKRKPYVRSVYFKKDKVFLDLFWTHLSQKPRRERIRRLKYYRCGLDLLRNSYIIPESRPNPNGRNEIVHRFVGRTRSGEVFYVQVKENRRGNKYYISVFPDEG